MERCAWTEITEREKQETDHDWRKNRTGLIHHYRTLSVWNILLHYIILKYSKTGILWNIIAIKKNQIWIYFKMYLFLWGKAEFSASLLQVSVSHNPSEITLIFSFDAQKTNE